MEDARTEYKKFNITPIFNIAASPEFNPIESVFAQVKSTYRRERLNTLVNEELFDLDEEVINAFKIVTPELVRACFKRSYFLLKKA